MRGFSFGEIKWLANGLGYQVIKLPPQRTYASRGRAYPAIRQSHVKVWRDIGGGRREFVCRQPSIAAAKTFIREYLPPLDRSA